MSLFISSLYPIILPFFIPFYYYAEYRAERNIRERCMASAAVSFAWSLQVRLLFDHLTWCIVWFSGECGHLLTLPVLTLSDPQLRACDVLAQHVTSIFGPAQTARKARDMSQLSCSRIMGSACRQKPSTACRRQPKNRNQTSLYGPSLVRCRL